MWYLIRIQLALLSFIYLTSNKAFAQRVLEYSDHEPFGGMRTRFLKEVFFPAIEKESSGRLKINAHWNGELADAYHALKAVRRGDTIDITTVVPEYSAQELPLHQIFKSFPVGPSGDRQVSFFRRVYTDVPELLAELDTNNLVEIFLDTGYPLGFFSRKATPDLNDLKGGKWRTASFWHSSFLKNLGALPVTMAWGPGIYKALKDTTLDGIMVNVDSGYDLKVHEHAPFLLTSRELWLGHLYLVVMNKATWNRLTREDRQAINRAAIASYKLLGEVMDRSFDSQLQTLKSEGTSIHILSHAQLDDFEHATKFQSIQDQWATGQISKGITGTGAVLIKVRSLMNEKL